MLPSDDPADPLGTVQVRAGGGWQYALADLSLILFLVTAAALARQAPAPPPAPPPPPPPPAPSPAAVALADPVAVWRAAPGAPSLDAWLAGQPLDPRQRLTIIARYSGDGAQQAFVRARQALAGASGRARTARVVVERGAADDLSATLTWDAGGGAVARPLQ